MTTKIEENKSISTPSFHPKYRADIDGLRAIAVLFVVVFHAFPSLLKSGFIGVDIFFVISGFLISSIIFKNIENDSFRFLDFYSRRIKRIFPALTLVLAASFVFGWFELLPAEFKELGKHIAGGAGFASNFVLWHESGYFDASADTKSLLHLWSLGIEEQFYIVWPLLLWGTYKAKARFLTIILTIGVISFTLNILALHHDVIGAFYSPQTRFWELAVGAFLAGTGASVRNGQQQNIKSITGALLIFIGLVTITQDRAFPGWWGLLPTVGAALIISAGPQTWINRILLSNKFLRWIGLISFPLYLWHWPILVFLQTKYGEIPTWMRISAIASSVLLAWLTYRLVETPIRSGCHSRLKTALLAIMMVIVGYVGYNCYARDGLIFRYTGSAFSHDHSIPKIILDLATYNPNTSSYRGRRCFLDPEQNYAAFDSCKSETSGVGKKAIFLWGDSHAAHLYPGYKSVFGKDFEIIQRTSSMCPPILNMVVKDRPNCEDVNRQILGEIKMKIPDTVVLAAAWPSYDWQRVDETIATLHTIGIKNIDVIGPVPQWIKSLPKQLVVVATRSAGVPYRMNSGLDREFMRIDPLLADLAKKNGANYISPEKILCNQDGCLTRLSETADSLTAWDYGHFTEMSSQYVVSRFAYPSRDGMAP